MLYMVECRFTDPAREEAWNAWYSGPRLDELLSVPGFLASQRLIALTRPGRYYLAVHSIDSLGVFQRPRYKAIGGGAFQGYQDCITDWVRRFFDGMAMAPAVGADERLVVADGGPQSVEGSAVSFAWVTPAGENDRGGPRGLAVVDAATGARLVAARRHAVDVYQPMIECREGTPAPA